MMHKYAKTKIIATLGPSTDTEKMIGSLIDAGVDAFRLNFSHGSHSYFEKVFQRVDKVCKMKQMPIALIIDLQGPKIRIGELIKDEIEIAKGEMIEITTDKVPGTREKISASYEFLVKDSKPGDRILIDDGLIELHVVEKKERSVLCKIIEGGILKPHKGINLPGMNLSIPSITEKDFADLEFALNFRIDYIALSFVRAAGDIIRIKEWLNERGHKKQVIAKIEKPEALKNIDEILEVSDAIMIARGDLGVELEAQEVPIIQKSIIRKCNSTGKLVITATQMLESMIQNPVPTRAEASDVANAVLDGTDVVMLSGETSVGKYPIEAARMMNKILMRAESDNTFHARSEYIIPSDLVDNLFDSTGKATVTIADQINADMIVVFTHFGRLAKVISKFRPRSSIVAMSDNFDTLNELNLYSGIMPLYFQDFDTTESAINNAVAFLGKKGIIEKGDLLILTAGAPITDDSRQNWLRFIVI